MKQALECERNAVMLLLLALNTLFFLYATVVGYAACSVLLLTAAYFMVRSFWLEHGGKSEAER